MLRYGSVVVLLMMLVIIANGDINEDKKECADPLVGLATCLPYVGNQAKAPTMDCCTGLNQVLKTNKKCLCILIKDKDDPSLGLKINTTLALGLPVKCNSPDHDISVCPALLHLAPNSPDAKVFTEIGKGGAAPATPSSTPKESDSTSTPIAKAPTNSGNGNRWSSLQLFYGVLFWFSVSILSFNLFN
ncbi:non-specific lipid transfer protein GPI-anchored 14-like [Silene latifolia]|uniref:non-specific lipid transfer protein GPI-anchored 14-like n=1 Tax=Silene latifolia TaxID=37657 RepID=UPI003D779B9C